MKPKVDEGTCNGCESCISVCPSDPCVFEMVDNKAKVANPDECLECEVCVDGCPEGAITMVD